MLNPFNTTAIKKLWHMQKQIKNKYCALFKSIISDISKSHFFYFLPILNFNIFGVFRKMNIFWGMIRFCGYFLGVNTKLDYI